MEKKTVKNTAGGRTRGLRPPWKKGEKVPGAGRPKGQRNYETIYNAAIAKIAKANEMTPEEFENALEQVGLKKAFKGDFQFYKNFQDRLYGKAVETQVLEVKGKLTIDEEKRQKAKGAVGGFLSNRNRKNT
jgi:hypothetical protein